MSKTTCQFGPDSRQAEGGEEGSEVERLAVIQLCDDIGCRLLSHALESFEIFTAQAIQIGQSLDETCFAELFGELLADAIHLQRAAPIEDRALQPRGTLEVETTDESTILLQSASTSRAVRRNFHTLPQRQRVGEGRTIGMESVIEVSTCRLAQNLDDLRNHITATSDANPVANTDPQSLNLASVVQRRVLDRDARDSHRSDARDGSHSAGPTGLPIDAQQDRRRLFGREFPSQSPAWVVGGFSEQFAFAEFVEFDYDAVEFPVRSVAFTGPILGHLQESFCHRFIGLSLLDSFIDAGFHHFVPGRSDAVLREPVNRLRIMVEIGGCGAVWVFVVQPREHHAIGVE